MGFFRDKSERTVLNRWGADLKCNSPLTLLERADKE